MMPWIPILIAVATLVGLVVLIVTGRKETVDERLDQLSATGGGSVSHGLRGSASASRGTYLGGGTGSGSPQFEPKGLRANTKRAQKAVEKRTLGDRLVHAGLYKKNSTTYFVITQLALAVIPMIAAFLAARLFGVPMLVAGIIGLATAIAGIVFPGLWLDFKKSSRQTALRRALPDALDVLIVCVEAGLSLPAAIVRVSKELATAHPMLSTELTIVHREIQMGNSTGGALRNFANRFDVDELRSLASVIQQSDKFGASIVKALRVHGETLRRKRFQMAQEKAQKAAVKLLFPTVLCIFPAMFIVILGPAAFDIMRLLSEI